MHTIFLDTILPVVFSDMADFQSDVWKKSVTFEKEKSYLVKAESGTGKSSLCSYIYGHRNDYSGNICFDKTNISTTPLNEWDAIRQKHLSLLFQELRLFPELTALENIFLKNRQTHYKTAKQIDDMLEMLGVSDRKNYPVGKMSWGQQQRIAIIRALCQPFDFLFLDEPISHLDEGNAEIAASLIQEEIKTQGAGLIITSIGKDVSLPYTQILSL